MTASMLSAIGHGEWVATNDDAYVSIVSRLAAAPNLRHELRSTLRDTMKRSPLYDAEGLVLSVIELDAVLDDTGLDDTGPDGVVQAIHAVVNPDKLGHLGPVSDVARLPQADLPAGRARRLRALPEGRDRVRVVGQLVGLVPGLGRP